MMGEVMWRGLERNGAETGRVPNFHASWQKPQTPPLTPTHQHASLLGFWLHGTLRQGMSEEN